MPLQTILNRWKIDPATAPNITAWQIYPPRIPAFHDFPEELDPRIASALEKVGINSLYLHQLQTWEAARAGKNPALVTGTSSGKTLAFSLPILDSLYQNPLSRALFLYPTKALAHDQLAGLSVFPDIRAQAYDGDTPKHLRKRIRTQAQIVVSNPDMLHMGILPYHLEWEEFFSHLEYIVIDEIHTYRGVFGSHVANVFRRLRRVTDHYGSSPQFILTSATIGNPRELAAQLIASEVELISQDSSSRGEKHFLIYNPPVIDQHLGLRASLQAESVRLSADLILEKLQTILFGRSRRSVEFMLTSLRGRPELASREIRSYRSGYLPAQRREIEAGLKTGLIQGVTATNALELGVDLGSLDAVVLAGYPGSIAAAWQQAGRSGRTEKPSLSVLVASSNPLDQYLADHPEYLFSTNPENGLIDPDNLLIVLSHLQCALYELPFREGTGYGNFTPQQTSELLEVLVHAGKAHQSWDTVYWMAEDYPAGSISLRTTSPEQITLHRVDAQRQKTPLGTIDRDSAFWMVHPGAIYLHGGESYQVDSLDLDLNQALLSPTDADYYTEAERQSTIALVNLLAEDQIQGASKYLGDIKVTSQVTGYKKLPWNRYQILSRETLDLPETTLSTQGFWLTLDEGTENILRAEGLWTSSPPDYGPDWDDIRRSILARDLYTCQVCGKKAGAEALHVHHKMPIRNFIGYQEANQETNLVSLCPRCHQRAEAVVRINSGIRGLGYALHGLAPLLLMCDPGDLGLYTDFQSPLGQPRPIVLLHEFIPGGIGFSRKLFELQASLTTKARDLVQDCPCRNGCPSCVGPGGEQGTGGKPETLAILNILAGGQPLA